MSDTSVLRHAADPGGGHAAVITINTNNNSNMSKIDSEHFKNILYVITNITEPCLTPQYCAVQQTQVVDMPQSQQ